MSDAFGNAHRSHASMSAITKFVKPAVAGFLLLKEVSYLSRAVNNPMRPVVSDTWGRKNEHENRNHRTSFIQNGQDCHRRRNGGTFHRALGYEMGTQSRRGASNRYSEFDYEQSAGIGCEILLALGLCRRGKIRGIRGNKGRSRPRDTERLVCLGHRAGEHDLIR